jgi:hypothetical protein
MDIQQKNREVVSKDLDESKRKFMDRPSIKVDVVLTSLAEKKLKTANSVPVFDPTDYFNIR